MRLSIRRSSGVRGVQEFEEFRSSRCSGVRGVQEFEEFKEFKEFQERSQEPESRSQEAQRKACGGTQSTISSKELGTSVRHLVKSGVAGPWICRH
jgi:hypothetical protein